MSTYIEFSSKPQLYYIIISSGTIFVSAYNEKSNEMFLIELPSPKSVDVMATFSNDFGKLCDNLDV